MLVSLRCQISLPASDYQMRSSIPLSTLVEWYCRHSLIITYLELLIKTLLIMDTIRFWKIVKTDLGLLIERHHLEWTKFINRQERLLITFYTLYSQFDVISWEVKWYNWQRCVGEEYSCSDLQRNFKFQWSLKYQSLAFSSARLTILLASTGADPMNSIRVRTAYSDILKIR